MRSLIIFLLAIFLINNPFYGQTKARVTDVDFHLEDRYIIINYNITGSFPREQMTIEVKFITENNEIIIPKTLTGDAGTKVFGDGMKTILWDIITDQATLSGNIKTLVTITGSKIMYSGPSNALLSVIVPGLGGYFVDKNKTRSVATTISVTGLMVFGLTQKLQANIFYSKYKSSVVAEDIQSLYSKANSAQHRYFISTRVAAGIWALDIIWVTIKGINNGKIAKSVYKTTSADGIKLNYVNNGLQFAYTVSF